MPPTASPPFFIVGAQRSGTTMLRLMLNQHSRLCVPFESVFIPAYYRRLDQYGDLSDSAALRRLVTDIAEDPWVHKGGLIPDCTRILEHCPTDYASLVDTIFKCCAQAQGKQRWGDKTPGYVTELDVLRSLFPDCRVIHLVRDGRDVALSLAGLSWGSRDLFRNAADWRWKVMLGRKMGGMMRDQYLEVRYEDLVLDPLRTLGEVCTFLEEDFEPKMMDYPERAERAMPPQSLKWHRTSVSPPDPSKVQGWRKRMSQSDQVIFEEVAGDALQAFGYEKIDSRHTLRSRIRLARYALFGRP